MTKKRGNSLCSIIRLLWLVYLKSWSIAIVLVPVVNPSMVGTDLPVRIGNLLIALNGTGLGVPRSWPSLGGLRLDADDAGQCEQPGLGPDSTAWLVGLVDERDKLSCNLCIRWIAVWSKFLPLISSSTSDSFGSAILPRTCAQGTACMCLLFRCAIPVWERQHLHAQKLSIKYSQPKELSHAPTNQTHRYDQKCRLLLSSKPIQIATQSVQVNIIPWTASTKLWKVLSIKLPEPKVLILFRKSPHPKPD